MTSRYHGSNKFLLTEAVICIVERRKKSMGYRYVPETECNYAQESNSC